MNVEHRTSNIEWKAKGRAEKTGNRFEAVI